MKEGGVGEEKIIIIIIISGCDCRGK